jgi:2-keto-4-pentenoate hydratase/2-oxohepta-3-ene-1,7-dioic acid hydratase in catechol pathway
MKTFGGFRSGDEFFYGELRGDEVHRLSQPYWIQVQPTGEVLPLASLQLDVPVAPSKLIAVGLNYADHIAEMKRTEIGAPLIWFKAPSSLLRHHGVIQIAFPEHQTDFETELAVVIGARTKNVNADDALDRVFGYTIGLDITDRDLQKQEKQFGRCKSFDSYTLAALSSSATPVLLSSFISLNSWTVMQSHFTFSKNPTRSVNSNSKRLSLAITSISSLIFSL